MHMISLHVIFLFNPTATPDIYTLSLHDALPICFVVVDLDEKNGAHGLDVLQHIERKTNLSMPKTRREDRKSTRLNSSHMSISYAVFCLKKKNIKSNTHVCGHKLKLYYTMYISVW